MVHSPPVKNCLVNTVTNTFINNIKRGLIKIGDPGNIITKSWLFNELNETKNYPFNQIIQTSFANQLNAKPINFYVRDFIDHITLTENGGRLRNYEKLSLAYIHVEIEIISHKGSAFDNAWYKSRWNNLGAGYPTIGELLLGANSKNLTWIPRYFVHRDASGEY